MQQDSRILDHLIDRRFSRLEEVFHDVDSLVVDLVHLTLYVFGHLIEALEGLLVEEAATSTSILYSLLECACFATRLANAAAEQFLSVWVLHEGQEPPVQYVAVHGECERRGRAADKTDTEQGSAAHRAFRVVNVAIDARVVETRWKLLQEEVTEEPTEVTQDLMAFQRAPDLKNDEKETDNMFEELCADSPLVWECVRLHGQTHERDIDHDKREIVDAFPTIKSSSLGFIRVHMCVVLEVVFDEILVLRLRLEQTTEPDRVERAPCDDVAYVEEQAGAVAEVRHECARDGIRDDQSS